jgi:diguanylate cyclase (GGDEF)-like protein/PAS domain S-box-containing protein
LLNRSLAVVFANRASRDLLELSATADVSGWRDRVMGSHRATLDDQIAAALGGTAPDSATMPFQAADGSSGRWLRVRIAPHLGASHQVVGLIAALEDVTAEVEARTESERLLYMLDTTSDFVTVFRPNGEILHTNTALGQVLERLAREGGTGRLVDLLGEERRDRFMANALNAVEGSDSWEGELEIYIGGGRSIPVSVLAVVRRDETGAIDWIAMTARDITRAKVAEEALRQAATVDHLTGLANRALFTDRLEQAARASERSGRRLAVLFCDLDRFKQVNDVYGHAVGDSVLRTIAMRLRDITREGDLAARVGGDEFVILCEGVTDPDVLAALADRVITSITRPIETPGGDVQVGISIGVAISQGPQVDGDRLLIVSDQAMYLAKAGGGNRYRVLSLDR